MKTKILTLLLVQFMALSAFAGNVITYTASKKLPETTSTSSFGFHTNAFNVAILSHTFSNGTGTITFGGDVTTIGDKAFLVCTSLTSITIPNSVTSIGESAFSECYSLTSITIPNSVTSIGNSAFYYCFGLTSITMGNSVTSIGESAFENCTGLTSIVIELGNTNYDSRDNCNAIIETSTNTLITGCKNTTIPNSVTSIGESAFSNCFGLTSITIPNSVTSIGDWAFFNCTGLTSVTIGNSVTSIGKSAFRDCSGLTSIVWNAKNFQSPTKSDRAPFYEISSQITDFTLGEEVESVPDFLCNGMNKLTSITIPNSVTSIGEGAFFDCSGLTSLTIPNSVTSIGDLAFLGCSGLTSATIPNSVTSIGWYAFYKCSGLTSVTIPNSVKSIGNNAFGYCSGLTSLTIPNSVTSIGESAFYYCSGLTSITSEAVTPPSCGSYCFDWVDHSIPVYVPAASVGAYKTAAEWKDFTNIQAIQATTHTLTVLSSNETLGSVMGSGEFALDTTVTIAALCKMDIVFSGWSDGNTDNPRQVTLTSDSTITAYFKEVEEAEYTIEVSAYNPALGTATATEMVLVEAVPYSGCSFVCWSDGNAENPRYIPLTGDINLQAIFSGTPTSVAETTDKAQGIVRKLIVDGQLHIIRNDKTYTIQGVVVE